MEHPAIVQAVVFGIPHPTLGEDLAACIVLKKGINVSAREIRRFAAQKLAPFKVPARIVIADEIPKGPTGKLQRRGLAEKLFAELTADAAPKEETTWKTPIEEALADIWREVLSIKHVNPEHDFLSLGGDSIRAMQIAARIHEQFGVTCRVSDLFDITTIGEQALWISQRCDAGIRNRP